MDIPLDDKQFKYCDVAEIVLRYKREVDTAEREKERAKNPNFHQENVGSWIRMRSYRFFVPSTQEDSL